MQNLLDYLINNMKRGIKDATSEKSFKKKLMKELF